MSKCNDFMGHARKAVNRDIYLWGGGQPLKTLAQIDEKYIRNRETSASNADRDIKLWRIRKDIYPDAYAADCSGGIIYCLMLSGLVSPSFDTTADGLMSKCTKLRSRSDLKVGDWVGQKSGSNVFHIGVVDSVENGQIWIIEWRGRDRGCVRTKIEDGAKPWNVYGRPDWVYTADEPVTKDPTPPAAETFTLTRLLKQKSPMLRGEDVHEAQRALIAKGYSCGSTGADGIFGGGTRKAVVAFQKDQIAAGRDLGKSGADGVVGELTCGALGGVWKGK